MVLIFFISEFFAQLCESAQEPLDVKKEKIENTRLIYNGVTANEVDFG